MFGSSKIKMCCGTPLVSTMIFRKNEWFCVKCRRAYAFMSYPDSVDVTDELKAEHAENVKWFKEESKDIIADGGMYMETCHKCKELSQPHEYHASAEEIEKSNIAREKLLKI